jgi:membrane-associated HD superfamily phosphohydrolase
MSERINFSFFIAILFYTSLFSTQRYITGSLIIIVGYFPPHLYLKTPSLFHYETVINTANSSLLFPPTRLPRILLLYLLFLVYFIASPSYLLFFSPCLQSLIL